MKRTLRIVGIVILGLFCIQFAYVLYRTAQVLYQDMPAWAYAEASGNHFPEALGKARGNLNRVIWAKERDLSGLIDPCSDLDDLDQDQDGDGLTAYEELWQLTSDTHVDSDEDGLDDFSDHCPNGLIRKYRDRVESKVISRVLKRSGRLGPTYCVTRLGTYWDIDVPGSKAIVVDDWAFFHIRNETDLIPDEPCCEEGWIRLDTRVFVPGFFYVYDVYHWFGGRCAVGQLVFVVDLPVLGPVHVGDKVVAVS
jgi:hypothetical protein